MERTAPPSNAPPDISPEHLRAIGFYLPYPGGVLPGWELSETFQATSRKIFTSIGHSRSDHEALLRDSVALLVKHVRLSMVPLLLYSHRQL